MNAMDSAYEVCLHLMGKDPTNDEDFENSEDAVDEFLYERYSIEDSDKFVKLLHDLAKMADRSESALSGKFYSGFATERSGCNMWLFKVECK